jgi:hypothetical protein
MFNALNKNRSKKLAVIVATLALFISALQMVRSQLNSMSCKIGVCKIALCEPDSGGLLIATGNQQTVDNFEHSAIPGPSSLAMFGMTALTFLRRRQED